MFEKILIIQTAFIGDVILTLPLLQSLRKNFPGARIDFLLVPRTSELLKNHPDVSEVIIYDKYGADSGVSGFFRLRKILSSVNYDVAFIPHRSLRSALLALSSGIKVRVGFDKSPFKFLYTNVVHYDSKAHEIERNLSLLEAFGFKATSKLPRLYPSSEDKAYVDSILGGNSNLIGVAPGSIWNTKRWVEEGFIKVVTWFAENGHTVALVGGGEDFKLCERIKIKSGGKNILNLCGSLSLLQSAELIRRCKVLISNDSAPMHMAVAVGTPVVAIFGSTVPEFGFYPYGDGNAVVEVKGLDCRPCGIHGRKSCPKGHFKCMRLISPEEVFETAVSIASGKK